MSNKDRTILVSTCAHQIENTHCLCSIFTHMYDQSSASHASHVTYIQCAHMHTHDIMSRIYRLSLSITCKIGGVNSLINI